MRGGVQSIGQPREPFKNNMFTCAIRRRGSETSMGSYLGLGILPRVKKRSFCQSSHVTEDNIRIDLAARFKARPAVLARIKWSRESLSMEVVVAE